MIVGLIGAGAIGTLVGATLAATCDVRVLVRDNRIARAIVSRGGLVLDDTAPVRAAASADLELLEGCDVLVVALKTYLVPSVLGSLRGTPVARIPVVSFSNGVGAVEQIEYAFGHHLPIALAPTTEAVRRIETGVARRTGRGATRLGWAAGHAGDDRVLDEFVRGLASDLDIERVEPIEPHAWAKLTANAAINPLTALAGVPNGAILDRPDLRDRAGRIAREVAAVARAKGYALPFDDPVQHAERVARATAENRSSMLVDLEAGTPTEIDAINGAVVREAAAFGIAVPENTTVVDEVRARLEA